jgi:predicted phosphodiesterase
MATDKQSKLEKLIERQGLTEAEVIAAIKSGQAKPRRARTLPMAKDWFDYGYMSDTHIGHEKFDEALFYRAIEHFVKREVDFIVHPGDHTEGMSGRPGHIYELAQVGYNAQMQKVVELYSQLPVPMFGIDGNHDQWFKQKNDAGAIVGEDLERQLENYTHLGEWEGDLMVGNIWIKLFHANDGTAYANSYKLQKLVESFTGGEKPHILHSGHYHKALYQFTRNIHAFESGTLCGQSQFMRGKKLPAHKGYGIVRVGVDKNTIAELTHTFFPAYD